MKDWSSLSVPDVLKAVNTKLTGLTEKEVLRRLKLYGKNIVEDSKVDPIKLYFKQYEEPLVFFLLIVSFFVLLKGVGEFIFIWIFLLIITGISFYYEYKSEKIIKGIRSLIVYKVRVIRNGKETEVDSKLLVPGDIILPDRGDRVPADARIIEEKDLEVDESLITGESFAVKKTSRLLSSGLAPNEQVNMLFAGSTVLKGSCKAVVVATGKETYIGKIGFMIKTEKKVSLVSKEVRTAFVYALSIFLFSLLIILLILRNYYSIFESIHIVTALAVSIIPQSLPLILTIILATSAYELGKNSILTRNVYSLENSALVDVICMDKTGTLTKNQMTARIVYTDKMLEVTGVGYEASGTFLLNKKPYDVSKDERLMELLKCAAFANNSILEQAGEEFKVIGSSTEGALLVMVEKAGLDLKQEKTKFLEEIPFDEDRKMHSVVYEWQGKKYVFSKGSPEKILEACSHEYPSKKLSLEEKKEILKKVESLAAEGYRVVAFAIKEYDGGKIEEKLSFIGFVGLIDPLRKEVKEFVKRCKEEGIELKILTGDHPLTAMHIAREAGIEVKACIAGRDLEKLNEVEFAKVVEETTVFARILPEQKLRIVRYLKKLGHRIMVTGDGVNDVLAFKSSHVGIAMERGSDIAKEFSDLVLVDENFANIYKIIDEGKRVVERVRSAFVYLISTSIAEVIYVMATLLISVFGLAPGSPLTPVQILWLNIVTEGLPAAGFAFERKFRRKNYKDEPVVSSTAVVGWIILQSILMGGLTFLSLIAFLPAGFAYVSTFAFNILIFFELFNAINNRSLDIPNFKLKFSNKSLLGLVSFAFILQLILLRTHLADYMGLQVLTVKDFLLSALLGSSILLVGETIKLFRLNIFPIRNSLSNSLNHEKRNS